MNKKDWKDKEKQFLEMQVAAKKNQSNVEQGLEELEVFLQAIRDKIETFK